MVPERKVLFIALSDNLGVVSLDTVGISILPTKSTSTRSIESGGSSAHCNSNSLLLANLCEGENFSSQLKHKPLAFLSCISLKLIFLYCLELDEGAGNVGNIFAV